MTTAYSLRRRLLFWLLISTAVIGAVAVATALWHLGPTRRPVIPAD